MVIFLQLFDPFILILPSKIEKMKLKTAEVSHFLEIIDCMSYLCVPKMKTIESLNKSDPFWKLER